MNLEKAVLVGLITPRQSEKQLIEYFDELAFLALTAGAIALKRFQQKVEHPDTRTYVGKGKLEEITQYVIDKEIDLVIFDDEITPSQQRNLEKELRCKVVDRPLLILDIFAANAKTLQARTQVELAQMQYLLPRIRGMWSHLDRVKGGIGMRGAGEKEIETDRRVINDRIARLKLDLQKIDRQSATQRKSRTEMIRVSLVGYTNVGKSTLMNALSKSEVLAENKLFATLDTTTRKTVLQDLPFLLSDTVGFIRKLPHMLIESFKSTLEEVRESDILLHVIDISHPQYEDQMNVVQQTLTEIDAGHIRVIYVFNKMDAYVAAHFDELVPEAEKASILKELKSKWWKESKGKCVFISALTKDGIDEFKDLLYEEVRSLYIERYPHQAGYHFPYKEWDTDETEN